MTFIAPISEAERLQQEQKNTPVAEAVVETPVAEDVVEAPAEAPTEAPVESK